MNYGMVSALMVQVLVDCSGSMSENIFERYMELADFLICIVLFHFLLRGSDALSKLSAAIELFYAFANRCDAYGFNHVIGIITFAADVSVKVEFTQIMDYFIVNFTTKFEHAHIQWYYSNLNLPL